MNSRYVIRESVELYNLYNCIERAVKNELLAVYRGSTNAIVLLLLSVTGV